jgi:hypothetical protein
MIPALCLLLAACGGGAEKTTPNTPPSSVTVTCPNGTSKTATTQALAEAACALPAAVSITPAHGDSTVSPDTFTGITLATDSTLDPASLTPANVTLKIGSLTTIAGSVAASGAKGVQFVPAAKLQYGQAYDFAASVKDTLGRMLSISSSFTTAALTCTLPQVLFNGACVTPVTVNCPNGTTQTAATQALAEAQCPAPVLIGQGSGTPVDPLTFGGLSFTTDSLLNSASMNVLFSLNGTPIAGSNAMQANGKGFVFTPATQLAYSSTYSWSMSVQDTLGKSLSANGTITTTAPPLVTCTLPAMRTSMNTCMSPPALTGYTWNDIIKAWVADIGTLVVGANTLPDTCVSVGDACWMESIANGTIKLVNSGVQMTGMNTRPVVFAFYRIGNNGSIGANKYQTLAVYADVSAEAPFNLWSGAFPTAFQDVKGSTNGIKITIPPNGCYEFVWKGTFFGNNVATCPI